MQSFQRHVKINFDHMRYLYKEDKRALPGNLQNRICIFSHSLPIPPQFQEEAVGREPPFRADLSPEAEE
jgi:hypothetical protein